MLSGKIKLDPAQETCSAGDVKGCGNPDCEICMPKGRPQDAGGALGGSPAGNAGGDDLKTFGVDVAGFGANGDGAAEMTAGYMQRLQEEMMRRYMRVGGFTFVDMTDARPSAPPRDPAREKAKAEEKALRSKVERFFLKTKHSIAWDDVIGNDTARRALVEAIEHPITHKKLYEHYRKKPTKGVLLYGPPGCGKTMFGKAAASVLAKLHGRAAGEHTMIHVKGPEIQSPYVGITEAIIRDVFAYARAYRVLHGYPLVVFIDEADAILPSRDGNGAARRALPWEESNVATFLTEMDGLDESGALVILATNRPHSIDAALLRDGRCDRKIKVERPTREAVKVIFERNLADVPIAPEYSVEAVASFGVDAFFSNHRRLLKIHSDKGVDFLTLGHIVNGAMVVGLVEQAKASAFQRDLENGGEPSGIKPQDMEAAIDAVLKQNIGLNHFDAFAEFCEQSGAKAAAAEPMHKGNAVIIAEGTEAVN